MEETIMANVHIVGGEKGGVGKSTFAKSLVEYLLYYAIPFIAIDTDRSAPDLRRAFEEPSEDKEDLGNGEGKKSAIDIRNAFLSESEDYQSAAQPIVLSAMEKTTVVNLSAASFEALSKWIAEDEVFEIISDCGIKFFLWFVSDGSIDSVHPFKKSLQAYGQDIQHILVRNEGRNRAKDWRLIDSDDEIQKFMKKYNVLQIDFPKFTNNDTFNAVRDNSLSFSGAIEFQKELGLNVFHVQQLKSFLRKTREAIDTVRLFDDLKPVESKQAQMQLQQLTSVEAVESTSKKSKKSTAKAGA
jgi:hypothetical protein